MNHPHRARAALLVTAFTALLAQGCSTCAGSAFTVTDGVMRFDVPGLGPQVQVTVPDITSQGANAQRARDIYVYDEAREVAHEREVYQGQSVSFSARGRRYRIEVTDYVEHLTNADEAKLCLVTE